MANLETIAPRIPASPQSTHDDIASILHPLCDEYPTDLIDTQRRDIPRIAYNLSLVVQAIGRNGSLCDIGGGVGLLSLGANAVGLHATLVDDFRDGVNDQYGTDALTPHARHGVQIVERDIIRDGINFPPSTFNAITTFDSMEHWHNSPKALFCQCMDALKPGGVLVIGVPNCVNLRKRLTVPFGLGKWSPMKEWYEIPEFRGHVREPDVGDLLYIARDLALDNAQIYGRNWLGYRSIFPLVRALTPLVDFPLRILPSLCSDIYLVGYKSGH